MDRMESMERRAFLIALGGLTVTAGGACAGVPIMVRGSSRRRRARRKKAAEEAARRAALTPHRRSIEDASFFWVMANMAAIETQRRKERDKWISEHQKTIYAFSALLGASALGLVLWLWPSRS